MTKTKTHDFVEVDYIGRIKETNEIFDLTSETIAKKENIFNPQAKYGHRVVCLGLKQLIPALDEFLLDKETGKSYKKELTQEQGFGKKDSKLLKIVNINVLRSQKINPFPGLQINASGMIATVRSVNGGRVTIDFNHPLAGKNLVYEIKINKIIETDEEKLKCLLGSLLGISEKDYSLEIKDKKATVKIKQKVPENISTEFKKKVKELTSIDLEFN
ncbi:MAG TPA: peptidylprolyl isomerase [Candidatus Nanoarchaeia archaeon]|nr:peptidylprolyl isomerase [Candidatus Nanoarchaeia archaeon]